MESKIPCEIVENWDDILYSFPPMYQDIYFSKKYLNLYESQNKKAVCAVCREKDNIMLIPFLRGEYDGYYDFETAYGYGGPISNTDDIGWCNRAFICFHDYLRNSKYLCGFTRFHPLFSNEKLVGSENESIAPEHSIQIIYDRQTIAIDTSVSEDYIWEKNINSKNRNMIRKAEKNNLEYKSEFDFASYDEFISLYRNTMQRLSADSFYFFDDSYFDKLRTNLANSAFLGTVRKDGKLICAAIFMFSKQYGHYHLEGSDWNYSKLGANNLILWKAACEMHRIGVKEFHLGGGTCSSPDDSLYKFKKAFSKNNKNFYIGKQIFDLEAYVSICKKWESLNPELAIPYKNRLLRYRA